MLNKILTAISFLAIAGASNAQGAFTITNPILTETTQGTADPVQGTPESGWEYVQLNNELVSASLLPFTFTWTMISKDLPEGWALVGFCDNSICYSVNSAPGGWEDFETMTSSEVAPSDTAILHLQIAAPVSAENGSANVKFQISTDSQTDTITYILTKNATGISVINAKDARVNIYPNPAANYINVFADKSLHPKSIAVFNILGRQLSTQDIKPNALTTMLDINALSSGMYMLRIMDENGKTITSRKFTKQ